MKPFHTDEEQYKEIRKHLKKDLEHKRYVHTMGVASTAVALAMAHGEDLHRAYLAGLLHDNAKCLEVEERKKLCKKYGILCTEAEEKNPELLHARLGACRAGDVFRVDDEGVLSAIACHTTGKPEMTRLEEILYIADYIEPNRKPLPMLDIVRKTAFHDLEAAMLLILEGTLNYLDNKKTVIEPSTMETYQYYLAKKGHKDE